MAKLSAEEEAELKLELHVADNRQWNRMRRLGLVRPFARFVKKGEKFHCNHEPAQWDHWIVVYRSNMIAHSSNLAGAVRTAVLMPKGFKLYYDDHGNPRLDRKDLGTFGYLKYL